MRRSRVCLPRFLRTDANVQSITSDQLVGIYVGRITNWKEVGGSDLRIRVIRREDIDSSLVILRQSMPGWRTLAITDRSKMAISTQEAIETAQAVPGAIGFGPYSKELENGLVVLKVDNLHPLDRAISVTQRIGTHLSGPIRHARGRRLREVQPERGRPAGHF